jgi:hypothetical protein
MNRLKLSASLTALLLSCTLLYVPQSVRPIDDRTRTDAGYLSAVKIAKAFYAAIADSQYTAAYQMTKKQDPLDTFVVFADRIRCIQHNSKELKLHCFESTYERSFDNGKSWVSFDEYNFFYTYAATTGCASGTGHQQVNAISILKGESLVNTIKNSIQFSNP